MNDREFNRISAKLEEFARQSPAQYKFRVALLALLGYGYLIAILSVLLTLVALVVVVLSRGSMIILAGKLLIFTVPIIYAIMKALGRVFLFKIDPPKGIPVDRSSFPELFALIDETTAALNAPRLTHVLVTPEMNAAVAHIPRFGVFGGKHYYLVLGLPLMSALSPDEFKAVLGHEVGHVSGRHGRFNGWIHGVRVTWEQLYESLGARKKGVDLFEPFLRWYWPYFNACSLALARMFEYDADACGSLVTGDETTARALIKINIAANRYYKQFQKPLSAQAGKQHDPPAVSFAFVGEQIRAASAAIDDQALLARDIRRARLSRDIHPSLPDRIAALGFRFSAGDGGGTLEMPRFDAAEESAADRYFGPHSAAVYGAVDDLWRAEIAPRWRHAYLAAEQKRQAIAEIQRRGQARPLEPGEKWAVARLTAEVHGPEQALPYLQHCAENAPNSAQIHFVLGDCLLQTGQEAGIAHLERAMALEESCRAPAALTIADYLLEQGRTEDAKRYERIAEEIVRDLGEPEAVHDTPVTGKGYAPHALPQSVTDAVKDAAARISAVDEIYIAAVEQGGPAAREFVVGIVRAARNRTPRAELARQLAPALQLGDPCSLLFLEDENKSEAAKLAAVPDALVYRRAG